MVKCSRKPQWYRDHKNGIRHAEFPQAAFDGLLVAIVLRPGRKIVSNSISYWIQIDISRSRMFTETFRALDRTRETRCAAFAGDRCPGSFTIKTRGNLM